MMVSACMIVKDEEANLSRCLRSLSGLVDEVVVVDTGSTDGTVEIAHGWGAHVAFFPWCDDFSAARNASFQLASGDFILWIDADEELIEREPGALRKLCSTLQPTLQGCWLACESLRTNEGDIGSVSRQWRLVRNRVGAHFRGRIHEQLALPPGSGDVNLLVQNKVFVRHWGYIPDQDRLKRKAERNRPMLKRAVAEEPWNPFYRYSLAKQHAGEGDFNSALEQMEQAIAAWTRRGRPTATYVAHMFAVAALAAVETGHYERALRAFKAAPAIFISADLLLQAGLAGWQLGRHQEAIAHLKRAHDDPQVRDGFEGDPSTATWRPLLALAHIYAEIEQIDEAYDCAIRSLATASDRPNVLYAAAFIAAKRADFTSCLKWARQAIAGPDDDGYKRQARRLILNIGLAQHDPALTIEAFSGEVAGIAGPEAAIIQANAHAELGDRQRQYDILDQGCHAFPADGAIRLALAELLDAEGHAASALAVLSEALDGPQPPPELYIKLARLLTKLGRFEGAADALELAQRTPVQAASCSPNTAFTCHTSSGVE